MSVKLVNCVMIENSDTGEVLVHNRASKKKYPGWSFPGGHVECGESLYDAAVREVKEETGLNATNLQFCGVLHWINRDNGERYISFMYKTTEFSGDLLPKTDEGENFWFNKAKLLKQPKAQFSSPHYALSPLFHQTGKYSEVCILHRDDELTYEISYK